MFQHDIMKLAINGSISSIAISATTIASQRGLSRKTPIKPNTIANGTHTIIRIATSVPQRELHPGLGLFI